MEKPLIWAHRGASGYLPENTLPAFQKAVDLGADGIELDVQLTKDHQLVVIHDETIDRTSNGTGYVKDYTLEQLRKFNFNRTHPEYEHADIPTMQEVFSLIRPTDLTINIELKTGLFDYEGIEEQIVDLTKKNGMEDRVIYSSFNHYSIARIRQLDPQAHTAFLTCDGSIDLPAYAKAHQVQALHPVFAHLRYPGFLEQCQEAGLEVNVWTVNTAEQIRLCQKSGVHAIITNLPDYCRQVLDDLVLSPAYQHYVDTQITPFLQNCVVPQDLFNTEDGLRLRLYTAIHPQEKASLIMVHGFGEFFGKYHETACRLYQEGYSICFLELRGHGDSQRATSYADSRISVTSMQEYVSDLRSAVQQVRNQSQSGRLYLFSHSMGGCVSGLYLEQYPEDFRCAVLSSPMLKLNFSGYPDARVRLFRLQTRLKRSVDDYAPGQGPFTGKYDLEHSSDMDADRYRYQFALRLENRNYQTWGGTWAWIRAALDGTEEVLAHADRVRTPVLVCQAGEDAMVDNDGQVSFVGQAQHASLIRYPGAKHELFDASEPIREKWYRDIIAFYHSFD